MYVLKYTHPGRQNCVTKKIILQLVKDPACSKQPLHLIEPNRYCNICRSNCFIPLSDTTETSLLVLFTK